MISIQHNWKKILFIIFMALLTLWVFTHQVTLSGGNAYNNYEFLSSDGIDWLVEGHYLWHSMQENQFPFELHVLRPPLYVVFTTLDAMLGGKGYVLSLVSALSMAGTVYYALKFIGNTRPSLVIYAATFILLILAPINYFRLFFQADPLATALSLAATWYVYQALCTSPSKGYSIAAFVLVTLSMLTQTYGLIAPSILFAVYASTNWLPELFTKLKIENKLNDLHSFWRKDILPKFNKSLIIILAALTFYVLRYFWLETIPHNKIPDNFKLLKFNPEMLLFYKMTWGYYLSPIIILIIGMCFWKKIRHYLVKDIISISMLMIVLVFMALLILYNWKDARFTYYFWPYLIILFIRLSTVFLKQSRIINGVFLSLAATIILSQTLHFYPQNYTSPDIAKLNTTAIKKRQSFIKRFHVSGHVDRLSLKKTCGDKINVCKDAKIRKGETKYRTQTHTVYLKLNGISNLQKEK